jgi:UDP-glucuronate decarboxylase
VTARRKTALVAGGAGFVGSHLCDRLIARNFDVTCVDNLRTGLLDNLRQLRREPRFTFIEHDVIEPLPAGLSTDLVFNFACVASPPLYQRDPVHTMLTSVVGTHNLLSFAAVQNARLLQASTSEIYGNPDVHPQPETYLGNVNPIGPRACYDEGKRAAETLCFDYVRQGLTDARVVRIFNTYGPRLRASDGRVISNMIDQALHGDSMTVYGDGLQTRSFCYVDDLIDGFIRMAAYRKPLSHPVNLGNPDEHAIVDIAVMIRRMACSDSPIVFRPLPVDDPCRRRPDISLAGRLLKWQPSIDLEAGLERTIAWFRAGDRALAPVYRPPARIRQGSGREGYFL